jgi:hypothetical protein
VDRETRDEKYVHKCIHNMLRFQGFFLPPLISEGKCVQKYLLRMSRGLGERGPVQYYAMSGQFYKVFSQVENQTVAFNILREDIG